MMKLKKRAGFTLVDLIAVLAVLTILVSLAMPKYLSIQDEARQKAPQTALEAGKKPAVTVFTEAHASVRAVDVMEEAATGDSIAPWVSAEKQRGY
ncbi:MAG TPA: type II secretion system protein [Syntrophales bacterium]|nr:type II secretion system protein [Syntrophales bacterium]HOX94707.1 type II secretion system protein [Syntrophales bacterium]HPI58122.1 type II secretion system protein [Syntrophales bacterium]HPN24657.1 type II secretion system protein [Syntrophales bacterium]HQM28962.1 type II secretion system protein [Syntrophales bacterium]